VTYTIFNGTPTFAAYRDGHGPWLTPTTNAQGDYELHITNDYQFVYVCIYPSMPPQFDAELFEATAADRANWEGTCSVPSTAAPPTTVTVTGEMKQAGTLDMVQSKTSTSPNWTFMLDVPTGTQDLVAYDSSRMVIKRGIAVASAMSLPMIDVAADGAMMTNVKVTITGRVTSDVPFTAFDLHTQYGDFSQTGTATAVNAPPSSLLTSSDEEWIYVNDLGLRSDRYVAATYTGAESMTFDLLPELTGITLDPSTLKATWTSLPSFDDVYVLALANGSLQGVLATPTWLSTAGSISTIEFDAAPPGYDPTWKIDLTGSYDEEFGIDASSAGARSGSMTHVHVGTYQPPLKSRPRPQARHAAR
jgi:hypothetical protein